MCREHPIVQLMRGPVHDRGVHPVLHGQHLADGLSIHTLEPLKERPGKALQGSEGMSPHSFHQACMEVIGSYRPHVIIWKLNAHSVT